MRLIAPMSRTVLLAVVLFAAAVSSYHGLLGGLIKPQSSLVLGSVGAGLLVFAAVTGK